MEHRISIEVDGRNCVGLDVGDRFTWYHVEDATGKLVKKGKFATDQQELGDFFRGRDPMRVALEVGPHSPWMSDLICELGHEVTVANAYRVALVSKGQQKGDQSDAQFLCWLLRVDPRLLFPIRHRGPKARADLALLRSRVSLHRARTQMINHTRGQVKAAGGRIPSISAAAFHRDARGHLPAALRSTLIRVLRVISLQTTEIQAIKKEAERLCREDYPETRYLLQVPGVGPLTALTFVLTIEDPQRFEKCREVGPYLGLVPRRRASGDRDPELPITKSGDGELRRLLVQCAHHILGRYGKDSDLRTWGLAMVARGKKNAKKRAAVAVARKLAVILLALWRKQEDYHPHRAVKKVA